MPDIISALLLKVYDIAYHSPYLFSKGIGVFGIRYV